jgi:hypothetical protein
MRFACLAITLICYADLFWQQMAHRRQWFCMPCFRFKNKASDYSEAFAWRLRANPWADLGRVRLQRRA